MISIDLFHFSCVSLLVLVILQLPPLLAWYVFMGNSNFFSMQKESSSSLTKACLLLLPTYARIIHNKIL
jgi:hypothetical protein